MHLENRTMGTLTQAYRERLTELQSRSAETDAQAAALLRQLQRDGAEVVAAATAWINAANRA